MELTGWKEERIHQAVVDAIVEQHSEEIRNSARKVAEATVKELVDDVAKMAIADAMRQALTDGWQKTDDYGRPTGKTLTLKDAVLELITKTNQYGDRIPYLDKQIQIEINRVLKEHFDEHITKAKKAFATQIDAILQGKVAEAIRSGLGLK